MNCADCTQGRKKIKSVTPMNADYGIRAQRRLAFHF
jgi:hypothetical protein